MNEETVRLFMMGWYRVPTEPNKCSQWAHPLHRHPIHNTFVSTEAIIHMRLYFKRGGECSCKGESANADSA